MTFTTKVNPRLIKTLTKTVMGDTHTPVSIFLKLRDKYKSVLMLEANDFTSKEDCKSYIAVDIVDEFIVKNGHISIFNSGDCISSTQINNRQEVVDALQYSLARRKKVQIYLLFVMPLLSISLSLIISKMKSIS